MGSGIDERGENVEGREVGDWLGQIEHFSTPRKITTFLFLLSVDRLIMDQSIMSFFTFSIFLAPTNPFKR